MVEEPAAVLLVDDRAENLVALEAILEEPGLELVKALSGEEALGATLEREFALVMLDVQMPGMDGFETARLMRGAERTRYLPIIFVTAIGKEERFVFEGYESGAVDYLFKPLTPEIVRSKVHVFVELHRQRRRLQEQARELERAYDRLDTAYQQIKADLRAAAAIQQTLLPADLPRPAQARFAWRFEPCDELAGDILNVFHLDPDHIGMYLLDVSGHGVQAALLSSALSYVMHAAPGGVSVLREEGGIVSPGTVLQRLHQRFPMDPETCQFFTILYGVLDLSRRSLCFASAGHHGPIRLPAQGGAETVAASHGPAIVIGQTDAQ
jgi:DNA-binding response OmpR family regulator